MLTVRPIKKLCQQNPNSKPSNFTIVIEEGNNPSQTTFPGSSSPGTSIKLQPGTYSVTEEELDPVTPAICNTMGLDAGRSASNIGQNLVTCTSISDQCEGNITIGNPQTCTIDNVIVQLVVIGNTVYDMGKRKLIPLIVVSFSLLKVLMVVKQLVWPISMSYTPGRDPFISSFLLLSL